MRLILPNKMTNAKKILITTETLELFVVHRNASVFPQRTCGLCSTEQTMLTLDEAVILAAIGTRKLMSLIDGKVVHSVEASSGHLMVCQKSLRNYLKHKHKKEMNHE
jgi:hypothetical protein